MIRFLILPFFLFAYIFCFSQTELSTQKDIVDYYYSITKKPRKSIDTGIHVPYKIHKAIIPAAGYTLQTGFAGTVASVLGFYTSKDTTQKISEIVTSIVYSEYNQLIFPIQANIWTNKNKFNIVTDWRYMSYPSSTFGLGGHTELSNGYTINFSYLKFHQAALKNIYKNTFVGAGYYFDYLFNEKEVNPPNSVVTSYEKYGLYSSEKASGLTFQALYDSRINQINSHNGWYALINYRPNFTWLGSDKNWSSLIVDIRKYIPISKRRNDVLALWNYNWFTLSGKPPYLLLPSTGWDDFYNLGRGYIQGRYRGNNLIYTEAEYRFKLLHNGLLGAVAFVNNQLFFKNLHHSFNSNAFGFGGGLRIKFNKKSNANLCLDYGIGADGSKGFFVNLGEIF